MAAVHGKVYVASMNMRGARAQLPAGLDKSATYIVNATSAQATANKNRRDFSPMTAVEGGYKGFWNFESYWQSGKVWENVPHNTSITWWKAQTKPKRRYPDGKGKKVLHAKFEHIPETLNWVESRKQVYVPEYYELIKEREMTKHWIDVSKLGKTIVVYDYDGPRKDNGDVDIVEVTVEMLKEKINETKFPFGHGFVVAATIAGIAYPRYA